MRLFFFTKVLLISILITNCSSSKNNIEGEKSFIIAGKWIVREVNFKGTKEDLLQVNDVDFYTLFGANVWSKAEGKSFEFSDDGILSTDLIPTEVRNKLKFSYIFNDNIDIKAVMNGHTTYEFKVVVDKIEDDLMIWKFSNYMDVKLTRKN